MSDRRFDDLMDDLKNMRKELNNRAVQFRFYRMPGKSVAIEAIAFEIQALIEKHSSTVSE